MLKKESLFSKITAKSCKYCYMYKNITEVSREFLASFLKYFYTIGDWHQVSLGLGVYLSCRGKNYRG